MSRITVILSAVVLVILLGSFTAPLLFADKDRSLVVGDYMPCSPDVVAGGAFEVVEYNDISYVHVKTAGIGEIDGKLEEIKKTPLCPIIIWGQSNAAYSSSRCDLELVNEIASVPKVPAFYYGSISRPCALNQFGPTFIESNSMYPALNPDGSYRIGELESGIIAGYCDNPKNIVPYLINLAIPATSLSEWLPGSQYMEWARMAYNDAISDIDLDSFSVLSPIVVMSQGEADNKTPPLTYISEFDKIYAEFKDITHFKTWLIIQTKKANGLFSSEAQKSIVSSYPDVMMGTTVTQSFKDYNGMMSPDYLHYSQLGDYTAGLDTMHNYSVVEFASENSLNDLRPFSYLIVSLIIISVLVVIIRYMIPKD